jgi:hypothetical protein
MLLTLYIIAIGAFVYGLGYYLFAVRLGLPPCLVIPGMALLSFAGWITGAGEHLLQATEDAFTHRKDRSTNGQEPTTLPGP